MRRIGSLVAALALTVLLVGSVDAAPRSSFMGSFDVLDGEGAVVGHITASFWATDLKSPAGSFSFRQPDGIYSTAQIGEASFISGDYKEVWFQGMEIFYLGGTHNAYNVFVGHFVDKGPGDRYVEFFGQSILGEGASNFYLSPGTGSNYYGRMDVGPGTFFLRVSS